MKNNNTIIDEVNSLAIPRLNPEDYKPSAELQSLGSILEGATEQAAQLDARAQYISSK